MFSSEALGFSLGPSGDAIIGTINKHSINIVENKGRHFPLGRQRETFLPEKTERENNKNVRM